MMKSMPKKLAVLATGLAFAAGASLSQAADWSTTEMHLQYGDLQKPFQGGDSDSETDGTTIITLQHASGWKYGDNFFFFDYLNYGKTQNESDAGAAPDDELYGEWYSNFSLGKITGSEVGFGFVRDIGILAGFNFAAEVDTLYYLPGVRFALDIPGFTFANLDVTAYIANGTSSVGVKDDDSYMVDFNWAYPFKIGSTSWSIEGHIEYIDGADQSGAFDGKRESWILAQPQLRLDLGEVVGGDAGRLFVGIEYQYWKNKLGDKNTDENEVQLLAVWRL
jgi:nucleoside-specific outer membrane channel protein Tsx